jgi:hypothetical protein
VADIVETDQGIRDEEDRLVGPEVVQAPGGKALEVSHHVVAQKTHGAAEKLGSPATDAGR